MPVQLVGKKVDYVGKSLWEIVGNLKNFGVGRLVIKSHFKNYAEPSYYKIVKVQPDIAPKEKYYERRVMVWAEHVFRGVKYPELVKMHDRTFKTKFQLIPRSEEYKYLDSTLKQEPNKIPDTMDWPPLLKILMQRKADKQGIQDVGSLKTSITQSRNQLARIAQVDDVLKPKPPSLYSEFSVKELRQKIEELKAKAEVKIAEEKSS